MSGAARNLFWIASAMIWFWLFNGELGLTNRLLALFGIRGEIGMKKRS